MALPTMPAMDITGMATRVMVMATGNLLMATEHGKRLDLHNHPQKEMA